MIHIHNSLSRWGNGGVWRLNNLQVKEVAKFAFKPSPCMTRAYKWVRPQSLWFLSLWKGSVLFKGFALTCNLFSDPSLWNCFWIYDAYLGLLCSWNFIRATVIVVVNVYMSINYFLASGKGQTLSFKSLGMDSGDFPADKGVEIWLIMRLCWCHIDDTVSCY